MLKKWKSNNDVKRDTTRLIAPTNNRTLSTSDDIVRFSVDVNCKDAVRHMRFCDMTNFPTDVIAGTAVELNKPGLLNWLKISRADINWQQKWKTHTTLLHCAAHAGAAECAVVLVENGTNLDVLDDEGDHVVDVLRRLRNHVCLDHILSMHPRNSNARLRNKSPIALLG